MRGKVTTWYRPDIVAKDHPRLCGEKYLTLGGNSSLKGITPAYAGKSGCLTFFSVQTRDHPRLCGEKSLSFDS